MNTSDEHSGIMRTIRAARLYTGDDPRPPVDEDVLVIQERPLTIDVQGIETYTLLCTPADRKALAVIESMADIKIIKECDDDPDTIRVRLVDDVPKIADAGRNLLIVSSCGACGSENLQKRIDALPAVGNTLKIKAGLLRIVTGALRERQQLFEACGGTHAAAVFDAKGNIISFAEDSGRHNALDKAIGKCLLAEKPTAGMGAALTSRLSLEMVSRCARAGIELIAGVSAPPSMAIDVAYKCNITLCAFVRETRATVFTHAKRIVD
jgi:FdhD protein